MKTPLILLILSSLLLSGCCGWRGWDRGYHEEREYHHHQDFRYHS